MCVCAFALQIEDLRHKTQLFSLNLDGNPVCDKLPDNIDFRLYIAAYLPKLKYYGYRVITNAERDKGRKIYKYVQNIQYWTYDSPIYCTSYDEYTYTQRTASCSMVILVLTVGILRFGIVCLPRFPFFHRPLPVCRRRHRRLFFIHFWIFEMTESIYLNNEGIYYDFIHNIKRNKLRILEENELDLATKRHEQSLDAERQHTSSESFVNDLDKHQLFESLFVNDLDGNGMNMDINSAKTDSIDM